MTQENEAGKKQVTYRDVQKEDRERWAAAEKAHKEGKAQPQQEAANAAQPAGNAQQQQLPPELQFYRWIGGVMRDLGAMKDGVEVLDTLRKGKHITQIEHNIAMGKITIAAKLSGLFEMQKEKVKKGDVVKAPEGTQPVILDKAGNQIS